MCMQGRIDTDRTNTVAEFKEFERRFKFKPGLKFFKFHLWFSYSAMSMKVMLDTDMTDTVSLIQPCAYKVG